MPEIVLDPPETGKETLASHVYDRLRQDIISVAIEPGEKLHIRSLCERFAVFHAGFESARDPRATVAPQRARAEARAQRSSGRPTSSRVPALVARQAIELRERRLEDLS